MISNITSKYQTNYKPLTKTAPTFAGDKDILIIEDNEYEIEWKKNRIREALGKEADEYTIHTAVGGYWGLKSAQQVKPFLTVTAYHMPYREKPHGIELIKELKKLGTKVIVVTTNWYKYGIDSMKAGIEKCEKEAGADKYIYAGNFRTGSFHNQENFYADNYSCFKVFTDSVKAIINGTPLPKYPFQKELKKETNK